MEENIDIEVSTSNQPHSTHTLQIFILFGVIFVVLISLYLGLFHLSRNDKYAFDMLVANIHEFKDPKSIKVISGTASPGKRGEDSSYALMCISANNSYGARVTGYYSFYPDHASDVSDIPSCVKQCKSDKLHTFKINLRYSIFWMFK